MTDARHERLADARRHVDLELAHLVELFPDGLYTVDDVTAAFADPHLRGQALGAMHRLDDVELIELALLAALLVWERGE